MSRRHVYIIAEAGVNHNGSLDLALQLCDAAKKAGADAVKFQTWKTELIIAHGTRKAVYQQENVRTDEDQFDMLKKLELTYRDFRIIKHHCDNIGIQFLSTADEEESLDVLVNLGIPFIKLGSGDLTNIPFLRIVGSKKLPVILSTGMSYLGEVERAMRILKDMGTSDITLLHCTTNYPCPMEEVNLKAMCTLRDAFKCEVGYSDHTIGIEVPIAAVAMGATFIEKHFTLDRNMSGPDHKASLNPLELKQMVTAIRNIENTLGDGIKRPNKSELDISGVVLKSVVAKCPILKGEILTANNLTVKRVENGISSAYWDLFLNTVASVNYDIDEPIQLK